ncbi:hypothetical protein HG530_003277 [Fusarium avenaceum]|nr:hypothetical protein HG530_003277 [Fusarium avenaceum]
MLRTARVMTTGNLKKREREHDKTLNEVTSAPFVNSQGISPQKANLLSEIAHDGEQASAEKSVGEVRVIWVEIAKALPRPPLASVVVPPDEGVDDGIEVCPLDVGDEDNSCEFAITVEVLERYYTG